MKEVKGIEWLFSKINTLQITKKTQRFEEVYRHNLPKRLKWIVVDTASNWVKNWQKKIHIKPVILITDHLKVFLCYQEYTYFSSSEVKLRLLFEQNFTCAILTNFAAVW